MLFETEPCPRKEAYDFDAGRWKWILVGLAALILGLTLFRMVVSWQNLSRIDHVSGAWITLATDLRQGIFYRPLFDPDIGYGGTRFFPLYFVLHSLFMAIWPSPFVSGAALTGCVGFFYLAGMIFLLRRSGVAFWMAGAVSILSLGGLAMQQALSAVRGDLLPTALTAWGLAFALPENRRGDAAAALCFTLAFAAKVTSVHGVAAVVVWRVLGGRWRPALRVGLAAAAGYALFLVVLWIASDGRIWEIMKVCSSGGATVRTILKSPWILATKTLEGDPPCLILCLLTLARLFSLPFARWREPAPVFFFSTLAITLFIFGSPGININHLIDLTAAASLVFGISLSEGFPGERDVFRPAALAAAVCLFFSLAMGNALRYEDMQNPRRSFLREVAEAIRPDVLESTGPVLSEDPVVPSVSGDPVFLKDAFMLARIIRAYPEAEDRLAGRIARREFRAIVLTRDPETVHPSWYKRHFSPEIIRTIQEHYRLTTRIAYYLVFTPERSD